MASTMKAWQFSNITTTLEDSITLNTNASAPTESSLSTNEILVKIISASLNPIDYKSAEMGKISKLMYRGTHTPGSDFCGRIIAVHSSVSSSSPSLVPGTIVFGCLPVQPPPKYGTLGQYTVANTSNCVPLPKCVSPDDAAAIGMTGLTAYQCLTVPGAEVTSGSKVLINGGSGGTGTAGIQIAKAMGASHVVVTCSSANAEFCRQLGADEVWDYRRLDLVEQAKTCGSMFDLVVDNVGSPEVKLYENCEAFLKRGGSYVQVGAPMSLAWLKMMVGRTLKPKWCGGGKRRFVFPTMKPNSKDLTQLAKWMEQRELRPIIDEKYRIEEVPKAYKKLKQGRTKGKIVILIDS